MEIFNIRIQSQQRVCKRGKANKFLKTKVLRIDAIIKVLLTGAAMTDYRKYGKFWSKPYENETLVNQIGKCLEHETWHVDIK